VVAAAAKIPAVTAARDDDDEPAAGRVTALLRAAGRGDRSALDRLFPLVYDSLRRAARHRMARERVGHTLSTTDLVHEAYLKLVRLERIDWQDRGHFLAIAAQSMRNILVDHALRRNADKRGGGAARCELDEATARTSAPDDDLVALDRALRRLERIDPRQCRVVECRIFAGLSVEETAEVLARSPASIKRDWSVARAWLNRELAC
jgi:RNA polymerase sigma factor (TIGR02999 family)